MNTREFFQELFEHKLEDEFVIVWSLPSKETRRFKNLDKATDHIEQLKEAKVDVYFGCGLQGKDLGSQRRGSKSDITGIPGFYVDVDVAHGVHQKGNLPPTIAEAVGLVQGHGYDPTLIIDSGHGIHAWWLFKKPWMFDTDDERVEWEVLSKRLQATIKKRAEKYGWTIDSTFDPTRVLRPPGTKNYKDKNNPVEVRLFKNSGDKYSDPIDFDQWLISENEIQISTPASDEERKKIASGLVLDANAEPPADKLDALIDADVKFKASWRGERDDFKDNSNSTYVMSMVSISAEAGWSAQEIANLIIAWYRRHDKDMAKALRADYIPRTLEKVKDKIRSTEYLDKADALRGDPNDSDKLKDMALAAASEQLGIKIIGIDKYLGDSSWYLLKTELGEVVLPNVKFLIRPSELQLKIADSIGIHIKYNKKKWPATSQALLDVCTDIDVSPESHSKSRIQMWLRDYLLNKVHRSLSDLAETRFSKSEPFVEKGEWYINLNAFSRWAWTNKSYTGNPKALSIELKRFGCEHHAFNVALEERKTTANFWRIPTILVAVKGWVDPQAAASDDSQDDGHDDSQDEPR
jgi:hypothetical protein